MCFSLATSRSLFSLAGVLVFAGLLLEGQWRDKWLLLRKNVPALTVVAMVVWFYASAWWTEATPNTWERASNVHWKLLLIPAVVLLIQDERWRKRCWTGFGAGMLVLLAHVYALVFMDLPWTSTQDPDKVFYNPLSQSLALTIFCAGCLSVFFTTSSRAKKIGLTVAFVLASYAVLSISEQRLGYLMWVVSCLVAVFIQLKGSPRLRTWSLLAVLALFVAVFLSNEKMQNRFGLVVHEIQNYQFKNDYTSVGSRLYMWYSSAGFIHKAPLLGHGMGAYPAVSEAHFQDPDMCLHGCRHPHNQYLFYTVEFGLIGLALLMFMLYQSFLKHRSMSPESTMPLVILVVFVLSSLVETTLWYRGFFYLFVPLLALSMLGPSKPPVERMGEAR